MNSATGTPSKKASSGLLLAFWIRSKSRPIRSLQPLLTYAQKPRTEAEEKSCFSHSRANEAVK